MPIASELEAVIPSIEFPCVVKGKPLTASFTHIEDNPINIICLVKFSDGYSSRFISGDWKGEGGWIDIHTEAGRGKKEDQSYAKAIDADLSTLLYYSPGCEVHLIVMDSPDAKDVNVWVLQQLDEPEKYDVHYLNDYRFTLEREKTGWKAYTLRQINAKEPSENLVRFISSRIEEKLTVLS